jgi:hypothetical protein
LYKNTKIKGKPEKCQPLKSVQLKEKQLYCNPVILQRHRPYAWQCQWTEIGYLVFPVRFSHMAGFNALARQYFSSSSSWLMSLICSMEDLAVLFSTVLAITFRNAPLQKE